MARHPDGYEVIAHLALPLPASIVVDVLHAIGKAVTRHGYTDVVLLTDGSSGIAAKPPERSHK